MRSIVRFAVSGSMVKLSSLTTWLGESITETSVGRPSRSRNRIEGTEGRNIMLTGHGGHEWLAC